jgi:hypothetical protein
VNDTETFRSRPGSVGSYVRLKPACLAIVEITSLSGVSERMTVTGVARAGVVGESAASGVNPGRVDVED